MRNQSLRLLPVFPLNDVILPPHGVLPLNIFEERYINMIDFALAHGRLCVVAQPQEISESESPIDNNAALYQVAGLGRIIHFEERPNQSYRITLSGMQRVRLVEEQTGPLKFRLFYADLQEFIYDTLDSNLLLPEKKQFLHLYQLYCAQHDIKIDWDAVKMLDDERLLTIIMMTSPFSPAEKQALLECVDGMARMEYCKSLFTMAVHHQLHPKSTEYYQ